MAEGNSKFPGFGFKEVMTLLALIFGVGGTWSVLNYRVSANEQDDLRQDQQLTAIDTRADEQALQMNSVQKDVEAIKDDVKDTKNSLEDFKKDTKVQLETILQEIRRAP